MNCNFNISHSTCLLLTAVFASAQTPPEVGGMTVFDKENFYTASNSLYVQNSFTVVLEKQNRLSDTNKVICFFDKIEKQAPKTTIVKKVTTIKQQKVVTINKVVIQKNRFEYLNGSLPTNKSNYNTNKNIAAATGAGSKKFEKQKYFATYNIRYNTKYIKYKALTYNIDANSNLKTNNYLEIANIRPPPTMIV